MSTQKCATNTMYKVLPGRRHGAFHQVPSKRMAPLHWSVVRNPYSRAVSLYGSTALRDGDRYKVKAECGAQKPDFHTFVERCLMTPRSKWKHRRPETHRFLFRNQSDWLKSGVVDQVVHLENLHDEVYDLIGLALDFPVLNHSKHQEWNSYLTPEVTAMLNEWAGADFELYGYEKL